MPTQKTTQKNPPPPPSPPPLKEVREGVLPKKVKR